MANTNTCKDCKYFDTCGDTERAAACSGYEQKERKEKATMKTIEQIEKDIQKNKKQIEDLTAQLIDIEKRDELRTAANSGNFARWKEIHRETESRADEIAALCDEIYLLKVVNLVLYENRKAAIVAAALPVIREECAKYEGKPYGEKTREKIRDAVRAHGFTFYFDGYTTKDSLKVARLDSNGCCYGNDFITVYTNYQTPFIDSENKLHFPAELKNPMRYTENPRKQAREILKTFEAYKKAAEKAEQAQNAINAILPKGIDHFHGINRPYPTLVS